MHQPHQKKIEDYCMIAESNFRVGNGIGFVPEATKNITLHCVGKVIRLISALPLRTAHYSEIEFERNRLVQNRCCGTGTVQSMWSRQTFYHFILILASIEISLPTFLSQCSHVTHILLCQTHTVIRSCHAVPTSQGSEKNIQKNFRLK